MKARRTSVETTLPGMALLLCLALAPLELAADERVEPAALRDESEEPAEPPSSQPTTTITSSEPARAASEETPPPSAHSIVPIGPVLAPTPSRFVMPSFNESRPNPLKPRFSVIELPRETRPGLASPGRPRHALSIRSETVEGAMKFIGVEASQCAMHFRAPSRLKQGSGGVSLEIRAEARMACNF